MVHKNRKSPIFFAVCAIDPCGMRKPYQLSLPLIGSIIKNIYKTFDKLFYEHCLVGAYLPPDFQRATPSLRNEPTNCASGFFSLSSGPYHSS